jgi:DNA-binding transcriptional regulator YiaG
MEVVMNDQSNLSFLTLNLTHFSELRKSKSGSAEMKRAGKELLKIMQQLGFKNRREFAEAMSVTASCISHWIGGSRKMQNPSLERLAALVQSHTSHEEVSSGDTSTNSTADADNKEVLYLPYCIPYERILHLAGIAMLLNEVGSEMTLRQVLECLAD